MSDTGGVFCKFCEIIEEQPFYKTPPTVSLIQFEINLKSILKHNWIT